MKIYWGPGHKEYLDPSHTAPSPQGPAPFSSSLHEAPPSGQKPEPGCGKSHPGSPGRRREPWILHLPWAAHPRGVGTWAGGCSWPPPPKLHRAGGRSAAPHSGLTPWVALGGRGGTGGGATVLAPVAAPTCTQIPVLLLLGMGPVTCVLIHLWP